MINAKPTFISVSEAARRAKCHPSRVYDWAAVGVVASSRSGGSIMIDADSFHRFCILRGRRRSRPKLRLVVDNT